MKALAVFALLLTFSACETNDFDSSVPCNQSVEATIRDLTGLDGCGYVFELNDGTRLEPMPFGYCGTPPLPKEVTDNPLFNFEFVDGKRVKIGYKEQTDYASICMVGPIVKITCIEEIPNSTDGTN